MPRTKMAFWSYVCDAINCYGAVGDRPGRMKVERGDPCNTRRGTEVHDQADADAHARTLGWQITAGGRQVVCPACTGKGGDA